MGHVESKTIEPMCAAELPWAPAVIVVFVTAPSGVAAPNASICAWSSQRRELLRAKADASGVAHLTVEKEDSYRVKATQPGYRAFIAEQVKTKPGCVTWVHAVTDLPAIE